jgi:UDP-glucose 4-epimerase
MNLCRQLVSSGARVRAFGRRRPFPKDLEGVDWYQGDFSDTDAVASAINSFEIVFHLIHTNTPQSASVDMAADVQQNVIGSLALLDVCRKVGIKRLVFVSSGGIVYGMAKQTPTPETAPTDPITAYGINKLAIEKYLALYERFHGLSFRILRVANPFGPFQVPEKNQGIITALISRALQGQEIEIWGDGSVVRDYIYVRDVVDALIATGLDQSSERVFNIGSGHGRDLREVIAAIEMQLGTKLRVAWKPGRAMDIPASVLSIDRAKAVLNWAPKTSFEDGLKQTILWWRGQRLGIDDAAL